MYIYIYNLNKIFAIQFILEERANLYETCHSITQNSAFHAVFVPCIVQKKGTRIHKSKTPMFALLPPTPRRDKSRWRTFFRLCASLYLRRNITLGKERKKTGLFKVLPYKNHEKVADSISEIKIKERKPDST